MKLSIQWLKEMLPGLKKGPEAIKHTLELAGLEVESMTSVGLDTILEVALPPNRGDCLSHLGLAREVAAVLGLKVPQLKILPLKTGDFSLKKDMSVPVIKDSKSVFRYMTRLVRGVRVAPSPQAWQERLQALGVRPVNNVVDATNLVMLELGHPLHAFDIRFLKNQKIVVRQQGQASSFVTLDSQERALLPEDLVIADSEGPVALAGIMGGKNSEIRDDTVDLVLEAASFNPTRIRRTARRLGLHTDSSHRFERWVNPDTVALALNRVTVLILEAAGGLASREVTDFYPKKVKPHNVALRLSRLEELVGLSFKPAQVESLLKAEGLIPKKTKQGWLVSVPAYRTDLMREIDLIEEVVRFTGFDGLPSELPPARHRMIVESHESRCLEWAQRYFASQGFFETIHYSFEPAGLSKQAGYEGDESSLLTLQNPISPELSTMRATLLGSLLQSLSERKGEGSLFEIRSVYSYDEGRVVEKKRLTGVVGGALLPPHWKGLSRKADFYFIKGIVEQFFKQAGISTQWLVAQKSQFHPLQCLEVKTGEQSIGFCGKLHPQLLASFGLPADIFAFDLDYALVASLWGSDPVRFIPYSSLPQVTRDLALLMDKQISYEQLLQAIRQFEMPWLKEVYLFDQYEGEKIPADKKSLALSLVFENEERTLTDEEVNKVHFELVEYLTRTLGVGLR